VFVTLGWAAHLAVALSGTGGARCRGVRRLRRRLRGVGVLFAAGVQERGSELGSVVADFVAVAGGGNEACVAEGKQVA
jgi:hypothetical protein